MLVLPGTPTIKAKWSNAGLPAMFVTNNQRNTSSVGDRPYCSVRKNRVIFLCSVEFLGKYPADNDMNVNEFIICDNTAEMRFFP
jgi:hypothetical protein